VIAAWFIVSVAASEPFHKVEDTHGMIVEAQKVTGSAFENLRVSTHTTASVDALSAAVWPAQPELKANWAKNVSLREVLLSQEDERLFYEVVGTSLVSDRDYVIQIKRTRDAQTQVVQVHFRTIDDPRHPPRASIVRIPRIEGECTIEPVAEGGSDISYMLFSEPGGSIPAFVAKGAQRDSTVEWLLAILKKAGDTRH